MSGSIRGHDRGDALALHRALVATLVQGGLLSSAPVEAAFRAVPRHLFLPDVPLAQAYVDDAIATKWQDSVPISSSSQPSVMAVMLEQLAARPGDRVLEIGTGTGYNAALLAHIVGEHGSVVTLDIDDDIVAAAQAHLAVANAAGVQVVCSDGALGYAAGAPYDRIILTVAADDIAPAWIEQLRPGGRLLLPLAVQGPVQKLVAFERTGDHLESVSIRDGSFMSLRGMLRGPQTHVLIGPRPGLVLEQYQAQDLAAEDVYAALSGPWDDTPATVGARAEELWSGFSLWLVTHRRELSCGIAGEREAAERVHLPAVFGQARFLSTIGLHAGRTLCLLARPAGVATPSEALVVRGYGPDAQLAQILIDELEAWQAAGRPGTPGLRIKAIPRGVAPAALPSGIVIERPHTELVLDWA